MIAKMAKVHIYGLMGDNIEVIGKMANNTEKVITNPLTEKRKEDSGKKAKESNGLKNERYNKTLPSLFKG